MQNHITNYLPLESKQQKFPSVGYHPVFGFFISFLIHGPEIQKCQEKVNLI